MASGSGRSGEPWTPDLLKQRVKLKSTKSIENWCKGVNPPSLKLLADGRMAECAFALLLAAFGLVEPFQGAYRAVRNKQAQYELLLRKHRDLADAAAPSPSLARKFSFKLPPPDSPLCDADRALLREQTTRPINGVPDFIAHRYAHLRLNRIGGEESADHASFVNLRLQPVGGAGIEQQQPRHFDTLADLLSAHANDRPVDDPEPIWQLRGEPGAGKSTLLLDLEIHKAYEALVAWQADAQSRPEVCVRLSLAGLDATKELPDVRAWMQSRWEKDSRRTAAAAGTPPTLEDLARRARLRFLLDGLNEITVATGEQRRKALQALCAWATDQVRAGHAAPVFTVRRLNYLGFHTGPDYALSRVADVDPWDEEKIQRFCDGRFRGQGNPLWVAIDSHPRRAQLIELFGNPFNLALQSWLFKPADAAATLAANRGDLMGRLGLHRLHRALRNVDPALNAAGLVDQEFDGPAIDGLLASASPRALHDAELRGDLLRTLQHVALAAHRDSRGGWDAWRDRDAKGELAPPAWQPAILAAESLSIATQEVGRHRFSHQLWQEYFAACALARGQVWKDIDLGQPAVAPVPDDAWELPTPEPSFWDQCVQLAVQIADAADANALLERLLERNLPLAGRAAAGRPDVVCTDLLTRIRRALLARSTDPGAELRQRIEAGLLLGRLGDDIRYAEVRGPDGVGCLLPAGERGWIDIPAGPQVVGGLRDYADSANTVEVTISPGTKLAFAPVTNAEFSRFVAAHGYGEPGADQPPRWWQGQPAIDWWHGRTANQGLRDAWYGLRKVWLRDGRERAAEIYLPSSRAEEIDHQIAPRMALDDAAFEAFVTTKAAPRTEREPGWWRSSSFNNPLQPVVGVCLWEAQAYCRWLSHHSGLIVRLPTEAEWEVAARGGARRGVHWPGEGRAGPSGGVVNHLGARVRHTTPIGVFPGGTAAEGWVDLCGQVWEWTGSAWTEDRIHSDKVNAELALDDASRRAVRGGSWNSPAENCRAAFRSRDLPDGRNDDLGFRLVVCPIQTPDP
jgi:formylglycine-generating enzyme required for sulfatase activity